MGSMWALAYFLQNKGRVKTMLFAIYIFLGVVAIGCGLSYLKNCKTDIERIVGGDFSPLSSTPSRLRETARQLERDLQRGVPHDGGGNGNINIFKFCLAGSLVRQDVITLPVKALRSRATAIFQHGNKFRLEKCLDLRELLLEHPRIGWDPTLWEPLIRSIFRLHDIKAWNEFVESRHVEALCNESPEAWDMFIKELIRRGGRDLLIQMQNRGLPVPEFCVPDGKS